jgi:cytochrome c551/c552
MSDYLNSLQRVALEYLQKERQLTKNADFVSPSDVNFFEKVAMLPDLFRSHEDFIINISDYKSARYDVKMMYGALWR